jgi:hypothetical protein
MAHRHGIVVGCIHDRIVPLAPVKLCVAPQNITAFFPVHGGLEVEIQSLAWLNLDCQMSTPLTQEVKFKKTNLNIVLTTKPKCRMIARNIFAQAHIKVPEFCVVVPEKLAPMRG